ncbi:MAG: thioredoxin family protein, partial [Alphaproteobacteria bacterium]|nr:thioredoxin family protein [Alphaproteobacteria bacterium]
TVVWLAWVYSQQTASPALVIGLVVLVAAAVLWRKNMLPILSVILVVIAAAIGVYGHSSTPHIDPTAPAQQETHAGSLPYNEEALATLIAGDKAVFVNMTADWCITCKVNERVALHNFDFAAANVAYMVGDWTKQDPAITKYLAQYGRNGVPLYVFYGARDTVSGQRPEAIVLPQILTPGIIAKTIAKTIGGED